MFTFFHRSKTITLDCFTSDSFAYRHAPITRGSKAFPDWWKNLPLNDATVDVDFAITKKNMRTCYGFLELYKRSVVVNTWADFKFKVTPNNGYEWIKSSGPLLEEHPSYQYQNAFTGYYHAKLVSPWRVKEKTGIHFSYSGALWSLEDYDFLIPPGILEFDLNFGTHANIFIKKKEKDYSIFLPVGKPLYHMIPLQEKCKIKIVNHLVSQEELDKLFAPPSLLRSMHHLIEHRDKQEKKKCPFHFGS
jgi:hypothetical protein